MQKKNKKILMQSLSTNIDSNTFFPYPKDLSYSEDQYPMMGFTDNNFFLPGSPLFLKASLTISLFQAFFL